MKDLVAFKEQVGDCGFLGEQEREWLEITAN